MLLHGVPQEDSHHRPAVGPPREASSFPIRLAMPSDWKYLPVSHRGKQEPDSDLQVVSTEQKDWQIMSNQTATEHGCWDHALSPNNNGPRLFVLLEGTKISRRDIGCVQAHVEVQQVRFAELLPRRLANAEV